MIRLAVPKARLWQESAAFLAELGFSDDLSTRVFHHTARIAVGDVEAYALKLPDIASIVHEGLVDFAIVSDEWLSEIDAHVVPLVPLCWYHARLCVLAPDSDVVRPEQHRTIATSFPNISRAWASAHAFIRPVGGSIEAFPGHLTDLAIDCVETGSTAEANGLHISDELMKCDVWLVASTRVDLDTPQSQAVLRAALRRSRDPWCTYGPRVGARVPA